MGEWVIKNPAGPYVPTVDVFMVWGYWPDEDVIELDAAVDEMTNDENPDYLQEKIAEARKKYGAEHVRLSRVALPWTPVVDMFDMPRIEADLPQSVAIQDHREPQEGS